MYVDQGLIISKPQVKTRDMTWQFTLPIPDEVKEECYKDSFVDGVLCLLLRFPKEKTM